MAQIDVHTGKIHLSRISLFQKIEAAQERRLTGTARAEDDDDVAFLYIHMDVL